MTPLKGVELNAVTIASCVKFSWTVPIPRDRLEAIALYPCQHCSHF